jgi:stress response protein YsnF
MLSEREVAAAVGTTACDADGGKLGTVEHFFVDDRTGRPSWVAVTTGLFGTRTSMVPVQRASLAEGRLVLPVTRDAVRAAPEVGDGEHLTRDDEGRLRRHYGLEVAGLEVAAPEQAVEQADGGMVRSEQRLRVGTERVAATRVRVVKYVVTEDVQITVPVRHEEIRLEEVPLDAPDTGPEESLVPAATGDGLPEEIVLHTERPVVTVEVVPTERVRLRTEVVEGQETVTGQVQREQIAVDQQPAPRPGR